MEEKTFSESLINYFARVPVSNYLETFDIRDYSNAAFIDVLKRIVSEPANIIGNESAFGNVYRIPFNPLLTLKVTNACLPDGSPDMSKPTKMSLCLYSLEGNFIYRIPNTLTNKTGIIGSNNILENIVGMLLYTQLQEYTSSFIRVYGFQYDETQPSRPSYTIMETLVDYKDEIYNNIDMSYIMFGTIHALTVAQKLCRFVHNDLHCKNIMFRRLPTPSINVYQLGNGEFVYTKFDYDIVIIDYGFSRMETENEIIIPRVKHAISETRPFGVIDYGFNPYYDIFSIIDSMYRHISSQPSPKDGSKDLIEYLMLKLLKISDISEKDRILNYLMLSKSARNWRIKPWAVMTENSSINYKGVSTPEEMLLHITEWLKDIQGLDTANNFQELNDVLNTKKVCVSDKMMIPEKATGLVIRKFIDVSRHISDKNTFYKYRVNNKSKFNFGDGIVKIRSNLHSNPYYLSNKIKPWNHVIPSYATKLNSKGDLILKDLYYHVATINLENGLIKGYSFKFDCCNIDQRGIFQNTDIKAGISINGAPFKSNFLPAGEFKTSNYSIKRPRDIGSEMYNYGGAIIVDSDGRIDILKSHNLDNNTEKFEKYIQYLEAGPLLVWNGKSLFTKNTFNMTGSQGQKIFQGRKPTNNSEREQKFFDSDKLMNIEKTEPGDLSHCSSIMARSALLILDKGDIVFICVESGEERGPGIDMYRLAKLCVKEGAVKAINLDGGYNSQMTWKETGETIINEMAPANIVNHPVGSTISFIKK